MTRAPAIEPVPERTIDGLPRRRAGAVNLRRDVYLFVDFVRREGLKRAHRGNGIPKVPALKLARILSWENEKTHVQKRGAGLWSDVVSGLARALGLVTFGVEGVYAGYSSTEPSFPDNEIEVDAKRFAAWLGSSPMEKETSILESLIAGAENEFFRSSSLYPGEERFNTFGCGVGPASRMPLTSVRRNLLEILADQPAGVWLPVSGLIDLLRATAPDLIVDPSLRKRPLSEYERDLVKRGQKHKITLDERYENFRERLDEHWSGKQIQLTETTPNVFQRVEGRYVQYFLQEVPYLSGFVDLAMAPAGIEKVFPPLESVRAFRSTERLRQIVRRDTALNRVSVTVLPNFDVLVEAPSWPDRELETLRPFCEPVEEDGPIHRLRIDRKKVIAHAAGNPKAPSARETLVRLCGKPVPHNVEVDLDAGRGHAQKLTVYEDVALVEIRGLEDRGPILSDLGKLAFDAHPDGFVLSRNPAKTLDVLEQRLRVPKLVKHAKGRFAACDGPLGAPPTERAAAPDPPRRRKVRLSMEDMVAYRTDDEALLAELHGAVSRAGGACRLLADEKLLLVSAADIPRVRSALEKLEARFDVELERAGIAAKQPRVRKP